MTRSLRLAILVVLALLMYGCNLPLPETMPEYELNALPQIEPTAADLGVPDLQPAGVTRQVTSRLLSPHELAARLAGEFVGSLAYDIPEQSVPATDASLVKAIQMDTACEPIIVQGDFFGDDGVDETYHMVSLLECNGTNYVSTVKDQEGDTCGSYARMATLETMLGVRYDHLRPETPDHPRLDFLPINFSEGFHLYTYLSNHVTESPAVIDGVNDVEWKGASHEQVLPDAEFKQPWKDWDPARAHALEQHYGQDSPYCQQIMAPTFIGPEEEGAKWIRNHHNYLPMMNCILDIGRQQNEVLADVVNLTHVPADICVDTQTGERTLDCSALLSADHSIGRPGDRYHVNYSYVDTMIRLLLNRGIPVRLKINWDWNNDRRELVDGIGNQYYNLERLYPLAPEAYLNDDGKCCKSTNHSVVIIGYLTGQDTNHDFWIIKNSHGSNVTGARQADKFVMIETQSTSGPVGTQDSTRAIMPLYGDNSNFHFYTDVNWSQLNPGIGNTAQAEATLDLDLYDHDQDGDTVVDFFDNCPMVANLAQADKDGDFVGDACEWQECETFYDRYQKLSNPYFPRLDIDQDFSPDACESNPPPSGFGILTLGNGALQRLLPFWEAGTKFGDWNLGLRNRVQAIGDFNGDELDDYLLRSSWGMGVVLTRIAMSPDVTSVPHGQAINGWVFSESARIIGTGHFNNDLLEDIVVASSAGIEIFTLNEDNQVILLRRYASGNWIGDWHLSTGKDVAAVGYFNLDPYADILVRSDWGIGILNGSADGSLDSLLVAPTGSWFGEWNYSPTNRITLADMDGNETTDLVMQSDWGLGVLTLNRAHLLVSINMVPDDARMGDWRYNAESDRIVSVGNFDDDIKEELILQSDWGIGVIERTQHGGDLEHLVMQSYAGRIDTDWNLGAQDRIITSGDFDGDLSDEFVIRSSWGIAIIQLEPLESNAAGDTHEFSILQIYPFGTVLSGWELSSLNVVHGVGAFTEPGVESLLVGTHELE
ncbi:MAG: hypothetical protein P1P76_05800 [Anaerolineales bacterium]|nr:hypothetical protein [Anaerolineales bacterium]